MELLQLIVFSCVLFSFASTQHVDVNQKDELTKLDSKLSAVLDIMQRQEIRLKQQEARIQEQQRTIEEQKVSFEAKQKEVSFMQQTVRSLVKRLMPDAETRANAIPKTCEEIRASDPSSPSGDYWIDPDGMGAGDDPILVYCDMFDGSTLVSHDSEGLLVATSCSNPGCYTRDVAYNATMRQMTVLTELSASCRQFIKVDCRSVPLDFNNVHYAWWQNRKGEERYYWSGSISGEHTCQCGIDSNCVDAMTKCNCDGLANEGLSDEGYITKKDDLPIIQLNFGRTSSASSYSRHTLGKLQCKGVAGFEGIPESCAELWQIGHFLNGFYTVKGEPHGIKSVYCDFSRTGEPEMESPTEDVLSPVKDRVSVLEVGQANLTSPMSLGHMPESCEDLWSLGFRSAGFYPVKSDSQLQMIYCDQVVPTITIIGNVDIKETVHFYVNNPGELVSANALRPISYDNDIIGHEAMSADTFTAPVAGTYQFQFHCQASTSEVDGEEVNKKTKVALLVEGKEVSFTQVDGYYWALQSLSLTATVDLEAGEKVQTRFDFGKIHDAYFGGTLLEKAKVIDP